MTIPENRLILGCLLAFALDLGCDSREPTPLTTTSTTEDESSSWSDPADGVWRPSTPATGSDSVDVIAIIDGDLRAPSGQLLPASSRLAHWVYRSRPEYYTSETLFELIDGGADAFLALGFEEAANVVLHPSGAGIVPGREPTLEITVYSMVSPPAALAKYDQDHDAGHCETLDSLPARHCLTTSSLDLLVDRHYIRLLLDSEDPALREPLVSVAMEIWSGQGEVRGPQPPAPASQVP